MKTSLGIWAFGPMVTRFVPGGYKPELAKEPMPDPAISLAAEQAIVRKLMWRLVQPLTVGSQRYKLELCRAERLFGAKRYTDARNVYETLRPMAAGDDRELVELRLAESDYYQKRLRIARDALKPYTTPTTVRNQNGAATSHPNASEHAVLAAIIAMITVVRPNRSERWPAVEDARNPVRWNSALSRAPPPVACARTMRGGPSSPYPPHSAWRCW